MKPFLIFIVVSVLFMGLFMYQENTEREFYNSQRLKRHEMCLESSQTLDFPTSICTLIDGAASPNSTSGSGSSIFIALIIGGFCSFSFRTKQELKKLKEQLDA